MILRPFRSLLLVASACTALLGLSVPAYAQTRVAVVDTQRAIMETEDGLRAQATLKKLFDNRQRELDKRQRDLQKERDDIEKQRDVLSKEALQKRIEDWQQEMMQIQSVYVEYNKELQKKQGELTKPIFEKTLGLIRRIASQEGYDMVVDKQAVAYVRGDLELTDRVISMYNRGEGASAEPASGSSSAPASKPAAAPAAAAPKAPAAPAKKSKP